MRWVLPEVVHPPDTICFKIQVPNERAYIGAFYGAIFALSKPYAWQDDLAHTAIDVGRVWADIFFALRPNSCDCPEPPRGGLSEDFEMPLRVDCDCNVFVTCCDGTEKQLLTADQVQQLLGQPGAGSPQPAPGGGCQTYKATLPGAGIWLLPTSVSTGDTIDVSNAVGATTTGSSGIWYCPDGEQFFAGACVGFAGTIGTDPLPAVNHMKLVAKVGSTFYDVFGPTFTVPSGHDHDPVFFQVNDDDLTDNNGSMTFDVIVCNNEAAPWSHSINLRLAPGGFTASNGGQWIGGTGWQSTDVQQVPTDGQQMVCEWDFGGTIHFLTASIFFNTVLGSHGGTTPFQNWQYKDPGGTYHSLQQFNPATNGTNQQLASTAPFDAIALAWSGAVDGAANPIVTDGSWTVFTLQVSGTGTDPF